VSKKITDSYEVTSSSTAFNPGVTCKRPYHPSLERKRLFPFITLKGSRRIRHQMSFRRLVRRGIMQQLATWVASFALTALTALRVRRVRFAATALATLVLVPAAAPADAQRFERGLLCGSRAAARNPATYLAPST
jgi:hypothetical protein